MVEIWIKEITSKLNRKKADILFGAHAAKDKNLTIEDIDYIEKTVKFGKINQNKSTKEIERVCFKNYFKDKRETYFVIVEYYPNFIKVVTVNKKKGKY